MKDSSELTFIAIQAAMKAGELLRQGYRTALQISVKSGLHNLVTQFDNAAEKAIIDLIRHHFPEHSFLAEESGASPHENAPVLWIIDPLDGTMNFVRNIPLFAVSIAAYVQKEVVSAVVYLPMTHELFVAEKGKGSFLNGANIQVSSISDINHMVASVGFPHKELENVMDHLNCFIKIASKGNPIRDFGAAVINLAYLAAGRFDAFWIPRVHPWDMAAGKLLVEEAGGKVSHYDGSPHQILPESSLLATNGLIHDDMVALLNLNIR
jgi:myo-inositol-1(or 4)-monophosphatase